MKTKNILYALTLMAYSLSLAHSVIPHHHHETAEEATAHKHHDDHHHSGKHHHHDHDEKSSNENSETTGHFFFFTHDLNIDFITKHESVGSSIKTKKLQTQQTKDDQVMAFVVSAYLVFHPPQDNPCFDAATISTNKLRGPPILLI